jgi:hypothetical protein
MVQEFRPSQPQYSCVVPIDSITGNADEEIIAFGVTAEDAKNQARAMLASHYGCTGAEIDLLVEQATIEPLAQWCASGDNQD